MISLTGLTDDQLGTTVVIDDIEIGHYVKDGDLYISVSGSDSIRDFARSVPWFSTRWPGLMPGKVHEGILRGAEIISAHIDHLIEKYETELLCLAGHSWGGAAVHCAAYLQAQKGRGINWIETYGEPPWMSEAFMIYCPSMTGRRYVCGDDPIPEIWRSYHHKIPPTKLPSQSSCLNPLGGLFDHRLKSYRSALDG